MDVLLRQNMLQSMCDDAAKLIRMMMKDGQMTKTTASRLTNVLALACKCFNPDKQRVLVLLASWLWCCCSAARSVVVVVVLPWFVCQLATISGCSSGGRVDNGNGDVLEEKIELVVKERT